MQRIPTLTAGQADSATQALLDAVQAKLGLTPNLYRTVGQSPVALAALLGLGETLSKGVLNARVREQIALVVAEQNGCDYCLAAHTAIGGLLKLEVHEMEENREGRSANAKTEAALQFARVLVQKRGTISDTDMNQVRAAGHSDAEIGEIVAHVALNTFTNYFNNAVQTDIDFPKVSRNQASV